MASDSYELSQVDTRAHIVYSLRCVNSEFIKTCLFTSPCISPMACSRRLAGFAEICRYVAILVETGSNPWTGTSPICHIQQDRHFHLKVGAQQTAETCWFVCFFSSIERWIKCRETAMLNVSSIFLSRYC